MLAVLNLVFGDTKYQPAEVALLGPLTEGRRPS